MQPFPHRWLLFMFVHVHDQSLSFIIPYISCLVLNYSELVLGLQFLITFQISILIIVHIFHLLKYL